MSRVQAVDHLVISVSDFAVSKQFYHGLFTFLGFEVMGESDDSMGWSNGNTRFWIYQADPMGKAHPYRKGDVGYHHYAWSLTSRRDVDELQDWLKQNGAHIADPAGIYYDDYYAVFFLDPDGLKLEGMHYGKE